LQSVLGRGGQQLPAKECGRKSFNPCNQTGQAVTLITVSYILLILVIKLLHSKLPSRSGPHLASCPMFIGDSYPGDKAART